MSPIAHDLFCFAPRLSSDTKLHVVATELASRSAIMRFRRIGEFIGCGLAIERRTKKSASAIARTNRTSGATRSRREMSAETLQGVEARARVT
jgi:hypothetical protein